MGRELALQLAMPPGPWLLALKELVGGGGGGMAVLFPAQLSLLSAQCQGKTFPSIHLWTRLLSALAGLLYASAIVAHDRRPEYLLRATPWFLTSLGRAALDLAVSTSGPGGLTACVSCPPSLLLDGALSQCFEAWGRQTRL